MNYSYFAPFVAVALAGCFLEGDPATVPIGRDDMPQSLSWNICRSASMSTCCDSAPLDSNQCDGQVLPIVEAAAARAKEAGMRYSEPCTRTMWHTGDCPPLESGGFLSCEDDCQIYYGEQPEGATCEAYGHRMSDCAQGLVCGADRICHRPCEIPFIAPEGGYCGAARGMWFVSCDAGLSCNADGVCEAAQPLGGACSEDVDCAVGSWCDASTSTCASDYAGKTACERHEQCTSDVCKGGACFEPESPGCGRWAW